MLIDKKRVRRIMDRHGLDVLVAACPANVTYLSDFRTIGNDYLGSYLFVVFPREPDREATLIVPRGEVADLLGLRMSWIKDVRTYGTFHITLHEGRQSGWRGSLSSHLSAESEKEPFPLLAKVLDEKGLLGGVVGLDERFFTGDSYQKVRKILSGATVMPAYEILREIRAVKNQEQTEIMTVANRITEKGIRSVLQELRVGMTGDEMVSTFTEAVVRSRALPLATSISVGEDSYLQNNYTPPAQSLRKGDLIRFDVVCLYRNHFTDIGRNAVMGQPTDVQSRRYEAVFGGEEAAIDTIRPGVRASEVFQAGVEGARRSGIRGFQRHHCGHGIGLELYEAPLITPTNESTIEEGSVLNIETPYYEMGVGGFMVEDTVLVTKKGVRFLTSLDRQLYVSPA